MEIKGRQMIRQTIAAAILLLCLETASAQNTKLNQNAEVMAQAARSLKFSVPENKAFFLEKQETLVTEVAIIFGYADNKSACEQIASVLSSPSSRAGTFRCHPTY
jgi:hypothetical protein